MTANPLRRSVSKPASWLAGQWRRDRSLVLWLAILIGMVLASIVLPFFLVDPNLQAPLDRLQGPSAAHWLGTDNYGRDILSRTVSAGRVSLGLAVLVTLLVLVFGATVGLVAGYYPAVSAVLMRLMDALMAFPVIVLAIALIVVLGSGLGVVGELIALVVVLTPFVARVVRSRVVALSQRGYVTAAKASGSSSFVILFRHLLPNALPTIMVQGAFVAANALLADASLSFLGLGVAPPTPTWGNMIAEARPYMTSTPLYIIAPGVAIVLAVMAYNMLGDSIRALVDPRANAILSLMSLRRRLARLDRRARRAPAATPTVTA